MRVWEYDSDEEWAAQLVTIGRMVWVHAGARGRPSSPAAHDGGLCGIRFCSGSLDNVAP